MTNELKRDPSPELAGAERWLRDPGLGMPAMYPEAIAAELDRLRALVARLQSGPSNSLTLYVPAKSDIDALGAVVTGGYASTAMLSDDLIAKDEHVFAVELQAREVKP